VYSGFYSRRGTVLVPGLGGRYNSCHVPCIKACSVENSENEKLSSDKREQNRGRNKATDTLSSSDAILKVVLIGRTIH
jgi:hypothetical protein